MGTTTAGTPGRSSPNSSQTVIFDKNGDLLFHVGPTKDTFRVCSRTVSRASTVFDRMLDGPWLESKSSVVPGQPWKVDLPEDDAFALRQIFRIIHAQFDQVKIGLGIAGLFQVCVVAHKYDLVKVLRPWARSWCIKVETDTTVSKADDRLLWIAWVLGHQPLFTRTATEILRTAQVALPPIGLFQFGKKMTLVTQRSTITAEFEYINSIGILDDIFQARKVNLARLLEPLEAMVSQLQGLLEVKPVTCKNIKHWDSIEPDELAECSCFLLGSWIRATVGKGLFPLPKAEAVTMSISVLLASFESLQFDKLAKYHNRNREWLQRHESCDLNTRVPACFRDFTTTFTPDAKYIAHLRKQRLLSGLPE